MEKTFENGVIIRDNRSISCGVYIENARNTIGSVQWSSKHKCLFIHLDVSLISSANINSVENCLSQLKEMLFQCEEFLNSNNLEYANTI